MDVSDVLRDRMQTPAGLDRMVAVSIALHVVVGAAILLMPGGFLDRRAEPPRSVMTISLGGGSGGADSGGLTRAGGQPVQAVKEDPKPEPPRAPAAVTPPMTTPAPNAKPTKAAPRPVVKQAPDEAKGRTPTRGAQVSAGSAFGQTGLRGQGFGLATGGAQGSGSTLDVADFCCPDYIQVMVERIRGAWNQNQQSTGECTIKFTIQRDGRLVNTSVVKSSGDPVLDLAARSAVLRTQFLPPLPNPFPNPSLTVNLTFQYR